MELRFNTPEEWFNAMNKYLTANPQITGEIKVAYQFEITGDSGGLWYIKIDNGNVEINKGTISAWDCRMKMAPSIFIAIAKKQMNPIMAFLSGRVQVRGNSEKLKYLQKILG